MNAFLRLSAFSLLLNSVALHAGDWPQWRGAARDGIAAPDEAPLKALAAEPKAIWRLPIGGGFSAPIVAKGLVLFMDEDGTNEVAHALDEKTGKEKWRTIVSAKFADEWGAGTRATPFADDGRVYVQSCDGEFQCLGLKDGKPLWRVNFEKDFGVKFVGSKAAEGTASRRGNNGSGLVDGADVIVPVGAVNGGTMVCFDKLTGKMKWKAGEDEAAYSSLQVADLAGVRQVVMFTSDALIGVQRTDGKMLWRFPLKTNAKRHASTPVIHGDHIEVNSHTFGAISIKVSREDGEVKAAKEWLNPQLKINLATPVLVGDHYYSHGPDKDFVCFDAATGKIAWQQKGFGKEYSSTLAVGGNLLVLADDGQLTLVKADAGSYQELGRVQVSGRTWSFPAYANGRLLVRDGKELISYVVGEVSKIN